MVAPRTTELARLRESTKIGDMSLRHLPILLVLVWVAVSCGPPQKLNVVIITLDTLRADRLGAYGYERNTSPHFDALAEKSVLFEDAYAQAVVTSPSHMSMMTGLRPHSHGVFKNGDRLQTEMPTLAERLAERGYQTGAFVSGTVLAEDLSDVSRGFEDFDAEFDTYRRGARATTTAARNWLQSLAPETPYFMFVHYYDTHGRYRATPERIARFRRDVPPRPIEVPVYQRKNKSEDEFHEDLEYYSDVYDAAIQQQDELFARLLRVIDRDRSIVVVLADHGESLGERLLKLDHGHYLFDEQTRIPLLLSAPGLEPRRVSGLVETSDLVPTLLDLLGIETTDEFDGRSLSASLRTGEASPRENAVTVASWSDGAIADRDYDLDKRYPVVSLVTDGKSRWKLIRYPGIQGPVEELFDLKVDGLEKLDVAEMQTDVVAELGARLDAKLPSFRHYERPPLGEELKSRLEALGYTD